jgi:C_GCAxxG_C_C family probable redox protein
MTKNADNAVAMMKQGFNCAQSVLTTCGQRFGLDRKVALRLAGTLGAGMGRMGEVCGAVTGAFMVIGLKYAFTDEHDKAAKEEGYRLVREFTRRFKERNEWIGCRELVKFDLSTEEGMRKAHESGVFDTVCAQLVRDATDILGELLPELKENKSHG